MSYTIDKNRSSSLLINTEGIATNEGNPARGIGSPQYWFYEFEPAEVVDIILDENHPEYTDIQDIGKAKVRMLHSKFGKELNLLDFAKPLKPQEKYYPLKHEIVIVVEYLGNWYYTDVLSVFGSINENSFKDISIPKFDRDPTTSADVEEYNQITLSGNPNKPSRMPHGLGSTFRANPNIKPLRPFEGDLIFEGRFGNSIRFGSNNQSPNIKIRVGQDSQQTSGLLNENVNNDASSLYLTENERLLLTPATAENSFHLEFVANKPVFEGSQIVLNSNRILLNAKRSEILGFADRGIHFVAGTQFTIDTGGTAVFNSLGDSIMNSPRIFLGSPDAEEPIVLGNELVSLLRELINIFLTHTHATGTGPSSQPIPPASTQMNQLANRLNRILSQQNFTL